ncbi:hypothetical protein [Streptomyces flavalbus]|uniref:Uncharacterized protein n=1 Tax=Streptomyces flavalbus TaxID=2665155 RepID=A0ABW2W8Q7_9ACTN
MIRQIQHTTAPTTATDPADHTLPLEVAHELHAPRTRAPELAPPVSRRPATRRRTPVNG